MNILFIFTSSLFFLWVIREVFFWLTLWQQNDYRRDRFFVVLKARIRRPKLLSLVFIIGKLFLFFFYIVVIFNDSYLSVYEYAIIIFYLLQSFVLGQEIYRNSLKKPALTLRGTFIILLTFATVFLFFAVPLVDRFFWLLFIDCLVPFFVSCFVLLFSFPIEIYSDWQIEKAGRKIRANKKLLVISVTGSYGKSLTKDYIAAVLQTKFNVVKTEGKNNTAIGVSRTILNNIASDTEIFVAEISAYQRGEIGMLCELIRPKIGVLTAINNHYRSLFHSLENIKKTNYELVESLPKSGLCLFDGNNKNTESLYKNSKKGKVLYRTSLSEPSAIAKNEIVACNMVKKQDKCSFDLFMRGKSMHLIVHGQHHIEQLLPGIYLADFLGMSPAEIKRAVASLS